MMVRKTLAIAEAKPGMRLAAAVMAEGGRLLVPAAAELTENLLDSLRRRDIAEIVVDHEVEDDPIAMAASRQRAEQRLGHLFRQAGDGQETASLYKAILEFRLEHHP